MNRPRGNHLTLEVQTLNEANRALQEKLHEVARERDDVALDMGSKVTNLES